MKSWADAGDHDRWMRRCRNFTPRMWWARGVAHGDVGLRALAFLPPRPFISACTGRVGAHCAPKRRTCLPCSLIAPLIFSLLGPIHHQFFNRNLPAINWPYFIFLPSLPCHGLIFCLNLFKFYFLPGQLFLCRDLPPLHLHKRRSKTPPLCSTGKTQIPADSSLCLSTSVPVKRKFHWRKILINNPTFCLIK